MTKLFVVVCVLACALCFVGKADAIVFTDTVNVGQLYGGDMGTLSGYYGGYFYKGYPDFTFNWNLSTPSDFEVPYDTVNSATVSVVVGWVDTFGGDQTDTFVVGSHSTDLDLETYAKQYELSIGSLFTSWSNGTPISCSLVINEDESWGGDIFLGESRFTLDYNNVSAPVPEPTTMMMLGMGLLGLAGLKKRA